MIWKAFSVDSRYFLLHIPSASILEVPLRLWLECENNNSSSSELLNLAESLSPPTKPNPQVAITHIALNVAQQCNLRCKYCYAGLGDYGQKSMMSLDVATAAIRSFDHRPLHIIFFGGEPLLNFKLIREVVEWCSQSPGDYLFSLTTNGVLLTASHLDFFKEHNFKLKISYDGKKLEELQRTHNKKQAELITLKLERFKDAIGRLRDFHLRMTFSREYIESFTNELLALLNSSQYRVQYARVSSSQPHDRFSLSDVAKLCEMMQTMVSNLLAEQSWDKLLAIGNLAKHIRNFHYGQMQAFCGAGINYLSVSTRGEFFLCHRFTEDREECIGKIGQGLDQAKLDKILELRTRQREPCRSCWMRNFCQGGCFHEHKMTNGSIDRIDPVFCALQDAEMKAAFRIYVKLRDVPDVLQRLLK